MLAARAGNRDDAGLERLSQHFEDIPIEFRQLVEKQYPVMGA